MEPDDQTEQDLIEAEGLSRQATESQAFLKQLDEKTRFTLYELVSMRHWEQARDAFDFAVSRTKPAP